MKQPFTDHELASDNAWRWQYDRLQALLGDTDVERAVHNLIEANDELRGKLAETEQSRDRYADLFEQAPVAYLAFDRAGVVHRCNRAACELFNYPASCVIGSQLSDRIAVEDRPLWAKHLRDCRTGDSAAAITDLTLKTVDQHPVQLVTPITANCQPHDLFYTILFDLTDHERIERLARETELFRELTGAIDEVFWLFDWDQVKPIYISPAYETVWGLAVQDLYDDAHAWEAGIHPDDRDAVCRRFYEHAAHQRLDHEYRVVQPDGTVRCVHSRCFPIRDTAGNVYRVAAVTEDVTDHQDTKSKLYQREQELAHVGRLGLMGEMASGVAHELNQPLTAISTYAEGLLAAGKADNHSPQLHDALDQIHTQAQRAGRIIHSLRKFAQKGEPELEAVDANEMIREVDELTRADMRRYGTQVHLDLAEGLPRLFVEPIEIEQVLVNLLHNAAQAMEQAGSERRDITISTAKYVEGQLHLTVRDTGPGLDDQTLAMIFNPFYTTKDSGLGIGLNICQTIIEHHHGRISAERNNHGGLTFHLLLPTEHGRPGGRNEASIRSEQPSV